MEKSYLTKQFLGLLALVAVVLVLSSLYSLRRRQLLRNWADDKGLEILDSKERVFFCGPFTWSRRRQQTVYFIRVRDKDGRERSGWARVGRYSSDEPEIEVRWKTDSRV
jgi:hypothetical protein